MSLDLLFVCFVGLCVFVVLGCFGVYCVLIDLVACLVVMGYYYVVCLVRLMGLARWGWWLFGG